jgi:hypothetical protein
MNETHQQPKRWIYIVIIVGIVGCVIAGVVRVMTWANAPNVTTIHIPKQIPQSVESTLQPLKTTYYHTVVPADYTIQNNTDPHTPSLTQLLVFGSGALHTQIGFTSNVLPSDGLDGVADYKLRREETSGYTLIPPDGFVTAEYVFRKTGSMPEMIAFALNKDRYLSVAISGGTESLQAEQMQYILKSLTWL